MPLDVWRMTIKNTCLFHVKILFFFKQNISEILKFFSHHNKNIFLAGFALPPLTDMSAKNVSFFYCFHTAGITSIEKMFPVSVTPEFLEDSVPRFLIGSFCFNWRDPKEDLSGRTNTFFVCVSFVRPPDFVNMLAIISYSLYLEKRSDQLKLLYFIQYLSIPL